MRLFSFLSYNYITTSIFPRQHNFVKNSNVGAKINFCEKECFQINNQFKATIPDAQHRGPYRYMIQTLLEA